MKITDRSLPIPKCPHCGVDSPNISEVVGRLTGGRPQLRTTNHDGTRRRVWNVYGCARCGGAVLVGADESFDWEALVRPGWEEAGQVVEIYPDSRKLLPGGLPKGVARYLEQALAAVETSPDGAVMLAGSAIDAMLKDKGLTESSLYSRIDQAVAERILTEEMRLWAHDVRMDANDQRHADFNAGHASPAEAQHVCDFAVELGRYLYTIPARVKRAREKYGKRNP